jgi:hypothetical protein
MRVLFATAVLVAGSFRGRRGSDLRAREGFSRGGLVRPFLGSAGVQCGPGAQSRAPGTVTISLEGTYLPDVFDETATPTTCRPGKGPENVNLVPGFVRPRLAFALANGTYLEISWVPPITINDVKPNLWGFALGRTVPIGKSTLMTGRVHATIGSIYAPFVCSESDLDDPANVDCFGGLVSNDRYQPNIFGAELALGWNWGGGKFRPYIGGGYNILHPRFQVDHTDNTGFRDRQKVEVNLSRFAFMGGATWNLSQAFSVSGEVYTVPQGRRHWPAGAGVFDREVVALSGRRETGTES